MAQIVPDFLPDHATDGERAVHARLQSLADDVLVFYEPIVKRRYPDFVVIHPRLGVLVIEVKDWRAGWIRSVSLDKVEYVVSGQERTDHHPVKQARQYQNKLMSLCQAHPYAREALMREGKFGFAFGSMALLTGISRREIEERGWNELFPAESTCASDEWDEIKAGGPAVIEGALAAAFNPEIPRKELTQRQTDLIRDMLWPSPLPRPAQSDSNASAAEQLKLLDLNQEQIARDMRQGHRVVYGVAGSGKTVIIEHRARLLAQEGKRVLILCFNNPLAEYLTAKMANQPNIEVSSFGKWAMDQGVGKNLDAEVFGLSLLAKLDSGMGNSGLYDSILIDEGQDFANSWFKCAVAALRDRSHSDLLIAYDLSQNLYGRPPITWQKVDVSIKGGAGGSRTQRLPVNYRNTFEIISSAKAFSGVKTTGDAETLDPDPTLCVRRGPWPMAVRVPSRSAVAAKCVSMISDLTGAGLQVDGKLVTAKQGEIRVLYARSEGTLVDDVKRRLQDGGLDQVSVSTIHRSKGLQARVVVWVFADQLPSHFPDRSDIADRALFYVAATRPEELLVLLYSHDTPYINEFVANLDRCRALSAN